MVIKGDVEVQLVDADNKEFVFPENQKNSKTYVEAEPGADFFVAIRRVANNTVPNLVCRIEVDGTNLGWNQHLNENCHGRFAYLGSHQYDKTSNKRFHRALRFVTPRASSQSSLSSTGCKDGGNIRIQVFEAHVEHREQANSFTTSITLSKPTIDGELPADLVKKKCIGVASGSQQLDWNSPNYILTTGRLLDTIEITYATYARLLHTGILP